MKTERMTILLTPQQKHAINVKAQRLNLSAGEVVRRAVEQYRENEDEALLAALADELERSVREARAALKTALEETRGTLEHLAGSKSIRKVA